MPDQRERPRHRRGSFYVKRTRLADGRVGWVGPIRGSAQADKEVCAWIDSGSFTAERYDSSPEVRAAVRAWLRSKRHTSADRRHRSVTS